MLRVLLTVIAAPLYALGWLVGKVWVVLTWIAAAVRVGFADASRPRVSPLSPESPEKVRVPAYPVPPSRAA